MIQLLGPNAIPLKEVIKQTYQTSEDCLRTKSTNYYGSKQVSEALIPLLLLSNSGRIVNVSSALGQLKVQNVKLILLNHLQSAIFGPEYFMAI